MVLASAESAGDDAATMYPAHCAAPAVSIDSKDAQITHRTAGSSDAPKLKLSHSPTSAASVGIAPANGKTKTSASPSKTKTKAGRAHPSMLQTFLERYQAANATKMYEVEELIDYYFHRRLAAVPAVVVSALPFVVTPNQITLFGLVFGWGAAACVYDSEFHAPFNADPTWDLKLGALLMFLWIVSDCADGQVARLCHRGTRTGRLLDGLIDIFVMFANCVVLGVVAWHRLGQEYAISALVAGISLWLHCITYDKIKNTYLEHTLPESECDGESVESVLAEYRDAVAKHPFSIDTALFAIYFMYLTAQAIVTSDVPSMSKERRVSKQDEANRRAYGTKYAHVVRLASWMGLSAHVTGLYLGYFAAAFDVMAFYYIMLYFSVVLNVVLVVTWVAYLRSGMHSADAASMAAP